MKQGLFYLLLDAIKLLLMRIAMNYQSVQEKKQISKH